MKKLNHGVTLLEMLIVLGLLSMILFSYPSLTKVFLNYQLDSYSRTLLIDFKFALNSAQNRALDVSLCISEDQKTCSTSGNLNDWQRGWIIFYDINQNFIPEQNQIIRRRVLDSKKISHLSDNNIKNAIRLSGRRLFGTTAGSGLPNGSMFLCAEKLAQISLRINIFGEARLQKESQICDNFL